MKLYLKKLKAFVQKMNDYGIPIPLLRINGKATFTGTMTFIAFNFALLGQLGKVTKLVDGVDLTQANYLFLICLGSYLGRRLQYKSDGSWDMEAAKKEEDKPEG